MVLHIGDHVSVLKSSSNAARLTFQVRERLAVRAGVTLVVERS